MGGMLAVLAVLLLAACDRGPRHDYYLLSLSWSPQYCAEAGDMRGDPQCRRTHGFVVHGLWPQYARGGWPEYCGRPPDEVPESVVEAMLPLMPSRGLIQHQWEKHGSCTGLSPERYFEMTRAARLDIDIPESFRQPRQPRPLDAARVREAFIATNPRLSGENIAVICRDQHLREVRICLDLELEPQRCGNGVHDRCTGTTWLRPVRGNAPG